MKIAFRRLPIVLAALFATPLAHAETAAETKPTEQAPAAQRDAPKRGGLFTLRSGVLVPTGNFADGLPVSDFGPGQSVTATLGLFVTPTIGILAAARGSFGHSGFADCKDTRSSSSKCGGITLQLPVLLEFVPTGRTRGFFADAGVGLLTTYSAYADLTTYSASSPIELKLGIGYRWEATFLSRQKHPGWGFELYASADLGRFSSMKLHSVDVSVDAAIAPKNKAVHATFDLGFAVYWGL